MSLVKSEQTTIFGKFIASTMAYYHVQFFSALTGSWITLKDFDDSGGTLVAVFDSAEQLEFEEAQNRLAYLSKKYPHLAFRMDKVIA